MKKIMLALLFVTGSVAGHAQVVAPADLCQEKFTYLQSIIKLNLSDLTCSDIIVAAKNMIEKKSRTNVGGFEFNTRHLQTLNTNPLICGRTDNNLSYQDRFGMKRTVDIGTEVVVKSQPIEKGILLPYMPESLAEDKSLKDLFSDYMSAEQDAFDKNLTRMYAKHVKTLKSSRSAVLTGLFKSIKSDEACANRLCYGFDKDNIDACIKELNGNNAYSYIEQKVTSGHTQLPSIIKENPSQENASPVPAKQEKPKKSAISR